MDEQGKEIFMKKYETPEMEIMYFDVTDIITTSNNTGTGDDPAGVSDFGVLPTEL